MKLELKYLAPYLPYGLEMCRQVTRIGKDLISREEYYGKGKIYSYIGSVTPYIVWETNLGTGTKDTFIKDFTSDSENKLLLRPLFDLTEEIEYNGEKFVPKDKLYSKEGDIEIELCHFDLSITINDSMQYYPSGSYEVPFKEWYGYLQKLFEWHIDVFGLIESGLAIPKE